jgi:hypothetical protein
MQRTTKLPLVKAIRTQARSFNLSSPLVTTDQAHALFEDGSSRVKFVDASWYDGIYENSLISLMLQYFLFVYIYPYTGT